VSALYVPCLRTGSPGARTELRWEGKAQPVLCKRRAGKGTGVRECLFDERLTWFGDNAPQAEEDFV